MFITFKFKFSFYGIFDILRGCFPIFSDLMQVLKTFILIFIDRICCCLFCFLSNKENLYMIYTSSDLFYDICNTINEQKQRQNHYLSFIDVSNSIWYLEKSVWKSSCINSLALSLIVISVLSLFECFTRSPSVSLEELKLIAIVKWIFHVSYFLRSFVISWFKFKYQYKCVISRVWFY